MPAMEILTFYPIIFFRVFIKTLKSLGLNINSKNASKIIERFIDEYGTLKTFHHEETYIIDGYEISIRNEGSNFKLNVSNNFSNRWEFNISKLTLKNLITIIENKFRLFIDADKSTEYEDFLNTFGKDHDKEKSKYIENKELESLFNNLSNKYIGWRFNYNITKKINQTGINISISFNYFKNSILQEIFGRMCDLKYSFQSIELKRIISYILSFCKRKLDFEFTFIELSEEKLELRGQNHNSLSSSIKIIDNEKIDETLSEISLEFTREEFHRSLIEKLFTHSSL